MAAVQVADPSFLISRKFSCLHSRILLYHQDELAALETELDQLDRSDLATDDKRLLSRRRDDAIDPRRKDLLQQIEMKLRIYGKLPIPSRGELY